MNTVDIEFNNLDYNMIVVRNLRNFYEICLKSGNGADFIV